VPERANVNCCKPGLVSAGRRRAAVT
jgi:hypothetical protein